MGIVGGRVGTWLLRRISHGGERLGCADGNPYESRSKLDVFFGRDFWRDIAGKVVVDFGCGAGVEAVEMAKRGAARVIGIDIRENALELARRRAEGEQVADRCHFARAWSGKADTIVSLDAFEHFADPGGILQRMGELLASGGTAWVAFGPPWYHPYGGHLFSVFPWAHLVFTESALIRWRSDFKSDGATRFAEVEGGLNQMTIGRFRKLVRTSAFRCDSLECIPIRRLRFLSNPATREFVTSSVRCRLEYGT